MVIFINKILGVIVVILLAIHLVNSLSEKTEPKLITYEDLDLIVIPERNINHNYDIIELENRRYIKKGPFELGINGKNESIELKWIHQF